MTWQSGETPGAASGAARLRERIREPIRARVRYTPEGCWVWQGQAIRGAHPIFLVENRRVYVHRVAWELAVGPIPSAHRVIRACATWLCVNPAHHVLVPHRAAPKRSEERPSRIPVTTCRHGHPYDEANTIWYRGARFCRECHRRRNRERQRRLAAMRRQECTATLS